jgi:uncharacterized membrane protein
MSTPCYTLYADMWDTIMIMITIIWGVKKGEVCDKDKDH